MAGALFGAPAPTQLQAVPNSSAGGTSSSPFAGLSMQPHHGLIGLVLVAGLIIIVLDRAGFRFAVTAGKR
jgi:hypothetical protein